MILPLHERRWRFTALKERTGWIAPAYVTLDGSGLVAGISDQPDAPGEPWREVRGYALPGFQNAHSHAFQYAMVGLAEQASKGQTPDDFWSWRETMYRFAALVTPPQLRAIAAMVYAEMLRHGITGVAEFHYLHHDEAGRPYANGAEMSEQLLAAAADAGIQLTLLPVLYQLSGFGTAPSARQRRFLCPRTDDYFNILESAGRAAAAVPDSIIGRGVHSLRAVPPASITSLLGGAFSGPAHLHIAEQKREVDACLAFTGQRPVAWLLDHLAIDERFSLVHATHVDAGEVKRLARCAATVVLCPSTEGNLGDGFFPLRSFWRQGGRFAIGSDSQVTLSPLEELRWLDYGQRLRLQKRQVVKLRDDADSGEVVFDSAWSRGRRSLGLASDAYFARGSAFDAVVIDEQHPVMFGKPAAQRLSTLIYGGDASCFLGTIRRGQWLVHGQQHVRGEAIVKHYQQAMSQLLQQAANN